MAQNNGFVTKLCNTRHLSQREKFFLDKAIKINKEQQRTFSCMDFPELSHVNFRQIKHKLREFIVCKTKSRPCFYYIKGITLPLADHSITERVRGDNVVVLLENLRDQPPKIHDLKLMFKSNIHDLFLQRKCSCDPKNKSIKVNIPTFDKNITAKLLIYPKTVQLNIGCTFKPFIYDISGVFEFTFFLGRVCQYIYSLVGCVADLPDFKKWMVTHYHFGKDGSDEYNSQLFHRTFEDFGCGLVRFYSKRMKDGKIIPRVEIIHSPKILLEQEIDRIIETDLKSTFS